MKLSIKLCSICASLVVVFALSLTAFAQDSNENKNKQSSVTQIVETPPTVARAQAAYRVGERLTYNVSFSNFPTAAHLTLLVANRGQLFNRNAIELNAHIETLGVVNAALYALNNEYRSYLDANTGLPFRTSEIKRDGAQAGASERDYNQPLGTEAIPSKSRRFLVAGDYDLLSAIYRVRALPLEQKTAYRLNLNSIATQLAGQYELEVRVTGREAIKTNIGTFNTVVTEIRVPDNKRAPRIYVYFTDDERHVPVLATFNLTQGEVRATIVSSELPAQPDASPTPPANTAVATDTTPPSPNPPPSTETTNTMPPAIVTGALPFKVGEQLNYNIFTGTGASSIGTLTLQVRPRAEYFGRNGLLLASNINAQQPSLPFSFDGINSYVDPETIIPFRTEIRDDTQTRIINLDQTRGQAVISDGDNTNIPNNTHDLISFLYALRRFRLTPPARTSVSVMIDNRPRTVTITGIAREEILVGGQSIPAVQLSLKASDAANSTTNDALSNVQMRLWVSEDARRLPLRFTAETPRGNFRADLSILPVVAQ